MKSEDTACDLIRKVRTMYNSDTFNYDYRDIGHAGLRRLSSNIYSANGGDRGGQHNVFPEFDVCKQLDVVMLMGNRWWKSNTNLHRG